MDIKKWRLFADIADTGNFTKSGERLGYSQSGVSHILKSMESEVGFPLFIRSRKGVSLTINAKTILPAVRSMLSVYDNLQQQVQEINGFHKGQIVIGTFTSISIHWLPEILLAFRKAYPGINIELKEGGSDEIKRWIMEDRVDFGFLSKRNIADLEWISLCKDPLLALLPKDAPAPEDHIFRLKDLGSEDFIISTHGVDYDIHYALEDAGVKPNIRFYSNDDHAIIAMVGHHLGISVLPGLVLQGSEDQIAAYPLEPYYERELGVALKSRERLSPASVRFLNLTKEILEKDKGQSEKMFTI